MNKTDIEAQYNVTNFMDDKAIRQKFVAKVYTILTAQIIFTCSIVILFLNITELKHFAQQNGQLLLISCPLVTLVLLLALNFIESLRRVFPLNFIFLSGLTTVISIEVSTLCVFSPPENVYLALYMTCGLFAFLTAFAYLNLFDISMVGQVLCWSSIVLMVLSIGAIALSLFGLNIRPLFLIITFITLLLVIVYIVYDTQIILGEGKVKLSEEEYILAVILLYVDLISLFKIILILLNEFNKND